jgi:hypothetical protein
MPKLQNLVGRRFGRLVVLARDWSEHHAGAPVRWLCVCDCGARKTVASKPLRRGLTMSCRCLHKEKVSARFKKHGMSDTSIYRIWKLMIVRCHKPSSAAFRLYGARGIAVCDEWRRSFDAFYRDMGPRPSMKHSIDRRDNDGGYSPGNCHWATSDIQAMNKRDTIRLTIDGETRPLVEWCRMTGSNYDRAAARLNRGCSHWEAIYGASRYSKGKGSAAARPAGE